MPIRYTICFAVAISFIFAEDIPMRFSPLLLCLLVLALFNLAGAKKKPELTIRFYAEVPPENGAPFSIPVERLDGTGTFNLSKVPTVSEKEITAFTPFQNADGSVGAYFFLDQHGTLLLETLSVEQRGKMLVALVNGRRVVDLLIDKRINDGIAAIPSGLTPQEIDLIRQTIKIREPGTTPKK